MANDLGFWTGADLSEVAVTNNQVLIEFVKFHIGKEKTHEALKIYDRLKEYLEGVS